MKQLRTGFTTGAYAAATALAAWRCLRDSGNEDHIDLLFPDGKLRLVNVDGWEKTACGARAWAKKDAGDDIDITNGAIIRAHIEPANESRAGERDYRESCGGANLILRAGDGVGFASRGGLDSPCGKWAINPVPRQMILANLEKAGLGEIGGTWLVEISIDKGEKLARKTLNPTLGIVDGLSVLGTSGIVVPCSNAAYITTIEMLLRGARSCGCKTAVLVTGGKTHRLARGLFPELLEVAFVRIGDFIRESLESCKQNGFERVVVICMPGKLMKYAHGHAYTHAHTVAQSMGDAAILLEKLGCEAAVVRKCRECRSVRELLESVGDRQSENIVKRLTEKARSQLQSWVAGAKLDVIVFNAAEERVS